jgi:hypothetical protein
MLNVVVAFAGEDEGAQSRDVLARPVRAHRVTGKVLGMLSVSGLANAMLARGLAVHGHDQPAVEMLQDKVWVRERGQRKCGQRWMAWHGMELVLPFSHFKRRWQGRGLMQGMQKNLIITS